MPRLAVKVIPKSRQERLAFDGDTLKVWLRTPPVDGRANEKLVEVLAEKFGISKSDVEIISGFTSRKKTVDILGVTLEQMKKSLD